MSDFIVLNSFTSFKATARLNLNDFFSYGSFGYSNFGRVGFYLVSENRLTFIGVEPIKPIGLIVTNDLLYNNALLFSQSAKLNVGLLYYSDYYYPPLDRLGLVINNGYVQALPVALFQSFYSYLPVSFLSGSLPGQVIFLDYLSYEISNLGLLINLAYQSDIARASGNIFYQEFTPQLPAPLIELLFGEGASQTSTDLVIKKNKIGVINADKPSNVLAGILFNSLYADSLFIKVSVELWEDIKTIKEGDNHYWYAALIVKEKKDI